MLYFQHHWSLFGQIVLHPQFHGFLFNWGINTVVHGGPVHINQDIPAAHGEM